MGTKVLAAYRVGDWVYIRSNGGEGLVSGTYLEGDFPTVINSPLPASSPLSSKMIIIDAWHGGIDLLAKTPFSLKLTRETDNLNN